jgi:hypothetical protein
MQEAFFKISDAYFFFLVQCQFQLLSFPTSRDTANNLISLFMYYIHNHTAYL